MPANKRLLELDILRAVAICMILLTHMTQYIRNDVFVKAISAVNLIFPLWFYGVALFFFLSGYVLYYSERDVRSAADIGRFCRKRAIRIFPLYWVALVLFAALPGSHVATGSALAIHFLGLQGLLAPRFVTPVIWFVGVLLLFYAVYPLIVASLSKPVYAAVTIFGIFAAFVVLRVLFGIVDVRFFLYFGVFVAGIIASERGLLYRDASLKTSVAGCGALVVVVATLGVFAADWPALAARAVPTGVPARLSVIPVGSLVLACSLACLFIWVAFNVVRLRVPVMHPTTQKALVTIAFSSYCIYLFSFPILSWFAYVAQGAHVALTAVSLFVILAGLPTLFVAAYALQRTENRIRGLARGMGKRDAHRQRVHDTKKTDP